MRFILSPTMFSRVVAAYGAQVEEGTPRTAEIKPGFVVVESAPPPRRFEHAPPPERKLLVAAILKALSS